MYKVLVFDLDGTMVDSFYEIYVAMKKTCEFYGIEPLTRDQTRSFIGPGAQQLLEYAIKDHGVHLKEFQLKFSQFYNDEHLDKTPCFEGVENTLYALKDKGFSLNVLSNKPYTPMINLLKHLNLVSLFDVIVGPETTGYPKPDSAGMKHIMDCCVCLPEDMLMVGDTATDLETASFCNIDSVLVSYGYGDVDALKKEFSPWAVIDRFSELEALLG